MSDTAGYSRTQIILHWLTAVAVVTAFVTHDAMILIAAETRDAGGAPFPTIHTAAGSLAMILILVRLWLRRKHGAPAPQGSEFNRKAAELGHRVLYALVIIVPILGGATWFGGIEALTPVHRWLARLLMLLALGHALMAIWHQVAKKDGTLTRMLRSGG